MTIVASIPSPSFNSLDIGPLSLNIYGLAIALGVVAAVGLFGRRLEARGVGTSDDASSIAIWAVIAGVIGARLYHVVTDWDRFVGNYAAIPKLWEGGLGIPGGLAFGIPVGLYMAKSKGISMPMAATCAAPAIPLAQAIGRLGNYFNQELFGRATDLPWALRIDDQHLPPGFTSGTTFHPTFLYELLWNLALCALLLWIDRKFRPALGQLMAMYIIGYGVGRFWVEGLRIDRADRLAGLRWNQWVAVAAIVGGVIVLLWMRRHPVLETVGPLVDGAVAVEDETDIDGSDTDHEIVVADASDGDDGMYHDVGALDDDELDDGELDDGELDDGELDLDGGMIEIDPVEDVAADDGVLISSDDDET